MWERAGHERGLGQGCLLRTPRCCYFSWFIYFICVLPACLYVHYVHTWWPQRKEEGVGSAATGVTDGYELAAMWLLGNELKSSAWEPLSQCPSLIQFHLFIVWIPAWHFLFNIFVAYLFTIAVGTACIHLSTVPGRRRSLGNARWMDAIEAITVTGGRKSCGLKRVSHTVGILFLSTDNRGVLVLGATLNFPVLAWHTG